MQGILNVRSTARYAPLYPGSFVGFVGDLGAGKTMSAVRLAYREHILAARTVYANFGCVFASSLRDIQHLEELRQCVLILDELPVILDSRNFSDKGGIAITQWINFLRKRGIVFLYTSQRFGLVDLRVRQMTQYLYECNRVTQHSSVVVKYRMKDEQVGQVLGKFVLRFPEYYNLYDTFDENVRLTSDGVASGSGLAALSAPNKVSAAKPQAAAPAKSRRISRDEFLALKDGGTGA